MTKIHIHQPNITQLIIKRLEVDHLLYIPGYVLIRTTILKNRKCLKCMQNYVSTMVNMVNTCLIYSLL